MGSQQETVARSPGRAALWIALSAVTLIIGAWISIPGIDSEVLAASRGSFAGLFGTTLPQLPIIGQSVGSLVAVRLALALLGKTESMLARSVGLVIYLALAAVQALALAMWAESASYEVGYGVLVYEPGWSFRLTATLTCVAGAALLWWLADRVDATRAATGALAFAAIGALVSLVQQAGDASSAIASGEHTPLAGLIVLVVPASMLALAVALAIRTPARWPVTVARSLELRSSFDVLAAPCALAMLAGASLGSAVAPVLVRAFVVAAGTVALIVLVHARVTERAPRRALWPLAAGLGSFGVAIVPLVLGLASSGFLAHAFEPGPLSGQASFRITLAAADRFRDGEAQAMVDRLEQLGASASIASADAQRITLRVENASEIGAVADALRPHTLALHLVGELPSGVPLPAGVRPSATSGRAPEGSCDALRAWAPSVPCTTALEPIREYEEPGAEIAGEPLQCRLHCLDGAPVVGAADVADARVAIDPYTNQPLVTATLHDAAAQRFGRVTGENIDRQLAIVLDDEVVSAPVIRSAIPGGEIQITLGSAGTYQELMTEAELLATTLRSGSAITSEWALESVEQ